jgi:hypothetical protein
MVKVPFTWRMLLRRGWVLLLGGLVGLGAGWGISRISVSASNAFQVSAVGADQTPYQSGRLALTYAQLLPEEPSVLDAVGGATHLSESYVRAHLTMSAQPATNIVFARFSANNAHVAYAALRALASSFGRATDAAGSRLRGTVTPLSEPVSTGGFSSTKALLLGVVAGLLAALSAILAVERRRPRVDELADLANILPYPVSRVSDRTLQSAVDVLARSSDRQTVELVTVEAVPRWSPRRRRLLAGDPLRAGLASVSVRADNTQPPSPNAACALLVRRGVPAIAVEESWRSIAVSGSPMLAAILVCREPFLRRSRGYGHGPRTA